MASRSIEDTLEDLQATIDRLQDDLRKQAKAIRQTLAKEGPELAARTQEVGRSVYEEGVDRARGMVAAGKKLWNQAGDTVSDARDTAVDVAYQAKSSLLNVAAAADDNDGVTAIRRFARERPVTTLFLAIAGGIILGRYLERS